MFKNRIAYALMLPIIASAIVVGSLIGYNIRSSEVSNLNRQLSRIDSKVYQLRNEISKPTREELYGTSILLGEKYGVSPTEVLHRLRQYETEPDFSLNNIDGCRVLPEACRTIDIKL